MNINHQIQSPEISYPETIPAMYRMGNMIVGHPLKIAELKAEINNRANINEGKA